MSDGQSTRCDQDDNSILDQLSMAKFSGLPIPKRMVDSHGWVRIGNKLIFWVPENYRNGLVTDTLMTIPTTGPSRIVRIDFSCFRYGTSWTTVYNESQAD